MYNQRAFTCDSKRTVGPDTFIFVLYSCLNLCYSIYSVCIYIYCMARIHTVKEQSK